MLTRNVSPSSGAGASSTSFWSLQVHPRVAERRLRLGASHRDRVLEAAGVADHPQAPPASAASRLDQYRVPDAPRQRARVGGLGRPARQYRQPRRDRVRPGRQLVPGRFQHLGPGSDEDDPGRLAGPREPRVLGQEAVPRMDRVRSRRDRHADDRLDAEVGVGQPSRPDPDRPVGHPGRHRVRVRVGHREHGLDAEPLAGADDPDGDLAAVGDQHPPDGRH
jgi:hypothetical protein